MPIPIPDRELPRTGIRSYLYRRSATHYHRGIDLPAPEGTPVYAAAAGTVEHARNVWKQGFTGYGRHVVIRHGAEGPWTLYAHLHAVDVAPGDRVAAGQQIGTVGRTKFSAAGDHRDSFDTSGAHLHFEVAPTPYPMDSEAARLDPVAWLEGRDDPAILPDSDRLIAQMQEARAGADWLALGVILLGSMWLARRAR